MRSRGRSALLVGVMLLGSAGGAAAQGRAGGITEEEESFQAAEEAFKENRDLEALKLYEKVTNMNPRRAEAWMKRAVILYKNKQYDQAVAVLDKGRGLLPGDAGLMGQLGLTLYRQGKIDAAVALLESAVAKQPAAFQLQLQLGQHYLRLGDGKKAVAAFEAYFKSRPEGAMVSDPQVRSLSGSAYLLDRQYALAKRDLEMAIKNNPRDASARAGLGAVYTAGGEWAKGISTYRKLGAAEAPLPPAALFNLATCLHRLNQRSGAEKNALAYTEAQPRDPRGWQLLGDLRLAKRDWARALEALAQARAMATGDAELAGEIAAREGRARLNLRQYTKAIEAFEEAAAARPDDVQVLAGLAEGYIATQQPKDKLIALGERLEKLSDAGSALAAGLVFHTAEEGRRAERQFEAALAANPRSYRARAGLAMTLNRLAGGAVAAGNLSFAEAQLARAQKLVPESVVTNRNLGLVLLLEGKYGDAEAALKAARERVDHDLVVNRLLGRAAAAQKKRDEAIRYYEAAQAAGQRSRGPQLAEVLVELGPLYLEAGRFDGAVSVLEQALREVDGDPLRQMAARNLAIAYLRRGLARLDDGQQAQSALDDIAKAAAARASLSSKERSAVSCALALATLKVGKPQAALDGFALAQREGGCQFKPPYDKIGGELFSAYAAYRDGTNPARVEQAAHTFQKVQTRAGGGSVGELLKDLARSAYEVEGYQLYARGDRTKATAALQTAQRLPGRGDHRELEHNLAVLELEEGRADAAGKIFEALGTRPVEALVNLGIVRDRAGESHKALDLYKKALEHGARTPHLREWIDVKERVLSRAGGAK